MTLSPYYEKDISEWSGITEALIKKHPLNEEEIVKTVLESWNDIFKSKIGGLTIGKQINPAPQIISFLLHELIPYQLSKKYPKLFRIGQEKIEKDIHCITDSSFSIEIKASSNKSLVYGNRSYAQQDIANSKKNKDGYYITINFGKFKKDSNRPEISIIRFGYLEHSDWRGQKSEKGQQANLSPIVYKNKLKILYSILK